MRDNYPVISKELNDILLTIYSHYVYILGYDNEYGETTYSGMYDTQEDALDSSIKYTVLDNSYSPPNPVTSESIPMFFDKVEYTQNLRRL